MRTQIMIIGAAFAIFGIIAWIIQSYSPAYVGLILFGVVCVGISRFGGK